jgi:hypothetical protein
MLGLDLKDDEPGLQVHRRETTRSARVAILMHA